MVNQLLISKMLQLTCWTTILNPIKYKGYKGLNKPILIIDILVGISLSGSQSKRQRKLEMGPTYSVEKQGNCSYQQVWYESTSSHSPSKPGERSLSHWVLTMMHTHTGLSQQVTGREKLSTLWLQVNNFLHMLFGRTVLSSWGDGQSPHTSPSPHFLLNTFILAFHHLLPYIFKNMYFVYLEVCVTERERQKKNRIFYSLVHSSSCPQWSWLSQVKASIYSGFPNGWLGRTQLQNE